MSTRYPSAPRRVRLVGVPRRRPIIPLPDAPIEYPTPEPEESEEPELVPAAPGAPERAPAEPAAPAVP